MQASPLGFYKQLRSRSSGPLSGNFCYSYEATECLKSSLKSHYKKKPKKELSRFSDQELLEQTQFLAQEERRIGLEVLHHLREVDRRRLYARTYSSLHEFVVKELHYSDGAAYRRIQAMRLLKELPEIEEQLQSGE